MIVDICTISKRGPRAENEDSVVAAAFDPEHTLIGVADGLGGHAGGKVASSFVLSSLSEKVTNRPAAELADIAKEIHDELGCLQLKSDAHPTMASTLSAGILHNKQMRYVHCGDTRIAVARGKGIRRLTTDHSETQRLM
jgi:protein phosphatase